MTLITLIFYNSLIDLETDSFEKFLEFRPIMIYENFRERNNSNK